MKQVTLTSVRMLRDEEELLLAEHALKAERIISIFRLVLQGARIVAFGLTLLAGGYLGALPAFSIRPIFVLVYTSLCVLAVLRTRMVTANVRRATLMPLLMITADYGFIFAMAMTTPEFDEGPQAYLAAVFCLLLLGFGALRLRRAHVLYSAALSVVVFGVAAYRDHLNGEEIRAVPLVFTFVTFGVTTALVLVLSDRVVQMFHTLRTRDNLRRFLPKQVAERVEKSNMRALDPVKR